jgi:pSer/pThr/pTyr-binding forkhead associated (FHA) protein
LNSISIGRNEQCDIVLDHESVSRVHARIELSAEGPPAVFDEDSRNGTWLCRDGQWIRIRHAGLGPKDRVRFGDLELDRNMILETLRNTRTQREDHEPVREVLLRPRRNPKTGKIEEQ